MKIDSGVTQVTLPTSVETRSEQAQSSKRVDSEQTEVSLSTRATQLKEMEAQLAAIPVVDRARVDSIKETIASGQYAIDTGNIASSLIDSVKEMLHVAR